MVQLLALSMIYVLNISDPYISEIHFWAFWQYACTSSLYEQLGYVFSQSHTYYFCMYSVKNDECPYDESYNVGCVIMFGP